MALNLPPITGDKELDQWMFDITTFVSNLSTTPPVTPPTEQQSSALPSGSADDK